MRKLYLALLFAFLANIAFIRAQVSVTATAGTPSASYTTVNDAFTAINAGTHQGAISITVSGTTTEPATPVPLLRSATPSAYSAITIKPQGNAVINSAATPTTTRAILELTGADNVTIDGDDPATTGTQNLSLVMATNTNTSGVISLGSKSTTGTDGDSNIVIRNCIITGGRASAAATALSYGIVFSNNATAATISSGAYSNKNITIQNNLVTRCYYGIYAAGASVTYPNINLRITGNTLGSATSADNIGNRGIFVSYSTSGTDGLAAIVEGNDVRAGDYGTTGYSATISGIDISAGNTGAIVRKNNVHDVSQPSISGYGAYGISVTSATTNNNIVIVNNFIRDIVASNYSTTQSTSFINYGIYVSSAATGLVINHNTIALQTANATGTTTNPVSGCININSSTATVSQLLNNILVNTIGSTNAYGIITAGTINISGGNVNNNNYYTPTGKVGYYNAAAVTTLVNWQAATSKDGAAININPPFSSATNLHISAGTTPTQLESGGAPVSVTNVAEDYDGQTRPGPSGSVNGGGTIPDIGADEFDGVPLDLTPPSILYTTLAASCNTGNRSITVTISDGTGVPVSGSSVPRVYFRKGASGTWYSQPGTLSSGTGTNGVWNFTITPASFGGATVNDVIQYYVIAQDLASTPNIASNPAGVVASNVNTVTTHLSSPNSYVVGAALSGSYTVGTGGNYATLNDAVTAFNNSDCLGGPVTLRLTDGTYTLTSSVVISNPTTTTTNTLTIKPATGIMPTITGALTNLPLIRINANNIIIDGSNATNGTTRDLTLSNTATTGPIVVTIASNGTTPITTVALRNTIALNGAKTNSAIILGDNATLGSAGYYNNITVQNNSIQNAYIALYTSAVVAAGNGTGLNISGNSLNTTGTNNLRYGGIYVQGCTGGTISGNDIGGFEIASGENDFGIWLATSTTNVTVEKNKIHDLGYSGSSGYGAKGITISSGTTTSGINVYNNMISNITGDGDSYTSFGAQYSPTGIYVSGTTTGVNIYYNTIYLYGSTINYSAAALSIGIGLDGTSAATVKNNIIVNKLGLSGTTGAGAVGIAAQTNAAQLTGSDNNDYFSAITGSGTAYIGRIGSTNYATLAAFRTASGTDAASINIDPVFVSQTDVHLNTTSNAALENQAAPFAGVTTDIDNQQRSTTPDMGADEINGPLPVTLLDLKGERLTSYNKLTWRTATEQNNKGFELQRSADGVTFTTLGFVASKTVDGNSSSVLNYSFEDAKPFSGVNFYRLKQVDKDGKTTISNVVVVKGLPVTQLQVSVLYPNPVRNTLNLVLTAPDSKTAKLVITDLSGRNVIAQAVQLTSGDNIIKLNVANLAIGNYLLKVLSTSGEETPVSKFVKQ